MIAKQTPHPHISTQQQIPGTHMMVNIVLRILASLWSGLLWSASRMMELQAPGAAGRTAALSIHCSDIGGQAEYTAGDGKMLDSLPPSRSHVPL
jgi:hypothetical protein